MLPTSSGMEHNLHKTHIKVWGVIVPIINGHVTRNKLGDIPHHGYFMGYADTTGVIIYWKPYQPFVIHRSHHVWFDEYNSRLSIEDKHTTGSFNSSKRS